MRKLSVADSVLVVLLVGLLGWLSWRVAWDSSRLEELGEQVKVLQVLHPGASGAQITTRLGEPDMREDITWNKKPAIKFFYRSTMPGTRPFAADDICFVTDERDVVVGVFFMDRDEDQAAYNRGLRP